MLHKIRNTPLSANGVVFSDGRGRKSQMHMSVCRQFS